MGASCWKRQGSWSWDSDPTGNVELRGWNVSGVKCTLKFPAVHSDLLQRPHPRKPKLRAGGCELSIIPVGMEQGPVGAAPAVSGAGAGGAEGHWMHSQGVWELSSPGRDLRC